MSAKTNFDIAEQRFLFAQGQKDGSSFVEHYKNDKVKVWHRHITAIQNIEFV